MTMEKRGILSKLIKDISNENQQKREDTFTLWGLLLLLCFGSHWFIFKIWIDVPITGADLHFQTLKFLKEIGFPSFHLRLWNPGNLAGEPLLVHYFPLPFILMALASFLVGLKTAYNVGVILPIVCLPFCFYFCLQKMKVKSKSILLITTTFTMIGLYQEGLIQTGGNASAAIYGQFSHLLAICFLICGIGFLIDAVKKNTVSLMAIICFSATALSHAYAFLMVPLALLSALVFIKSYKQIASALGILIITGLSTLFLSAWFLWPMIDNHRWITPRGSYSGPGGLITVFEHPIFYPIYILSAIALFLLSVMAINAVIRKWKIPFFPLRALLKIRTSRENPNQQLNLFKPIVFFILLAVFGFILFFFIRIIPIPMNFRGIPQIMYPILIALGLFCSGVFQRFYHQIIHYLTFPVMLFILVWIIFHTKHLPGIINSYYHNWKAYSGYVELEQVFKDLPRGLSRSRIFCETHVCGMMPSLFERSSIVSTYLESNLLAPQARYINDYDWVARESCSVFSFHYYICPQNKLDSMEAKLRLMGVGSVIFEKNKKSEMSKTSNLIKVGEYGKWLYYRFDNIPRLAEPIYGSAEIQPKTKDFRHTMNKWFDEYNGSNHWQIIDLGSNSVEEFQKAIESSPQKYCNIDIQVDFFGFDFLTSCVGSPHILKFAYHSSFRNSTGDPIYLISPGMIGVIPSQEKIRFQFGQSFSWKLANWISILTVLILIIFIPFNRLFFKRAPFLF